MRTFIYLISFLLAGLNASAQIGTSNNPECKADGETFIVTEGNLRFTPSDNIKLGIGTLPNGDFKYISFSRNNWVSAMNADPRANYLGAKWTGHLFKVKGFIEYGNKRRGYTYYLRLGGGNIVDYECDIINALRTGEVVVEGYTPPSQRPVIVEQNSSVADELKKLKELKDQGVLTQEEFDAQKQKLLNK